MTHQETFMRKNQINLTVSAAALMIGIAGVATPAHATDAIYGGGGTLAAKIYRQIFNCYATPVFGSTLPNTVEGATTPFPAGLPTTECSTVAGSPIPYKAPFNATAATVEFLYAPVGSGGGLNGFTTNLASNLGTPATSNAVAFTTSAHSAYPYPALDFASSDAAMTTTQIAAIGKSNGLAAIQVPSFATPISLPFNPGAGFTYSKSSSYKTPVGGSSQLRLSITSVCGIFTGKITNWDNSQITIDNNHVKVATAPITVYVRADGSGTSAIFSNWLVINCAKTKYPVASGFTISTTPAWPAKFEKVAGSGGMANAISTSPYSIGYVSPDYVQPVVSTGPVAANVINPLGEGMPPSAAATAAALTDSNLKAPTTLAAAKWGQPINDTLATDSTTATNFPKNAYPIVGFTFLDFYQCYSATSRHNPRVANELKYFFDNFYLSASSAEMTLLLTNDGFARPSSTFLAGERSLISQISYTGTLNGVKGSAACNASGVVGVDG